MTPNALHSHDTAFRCLSFLAGFVLVALEAAATLQRETIATGFSNPLFVTAPPGDTSRLFVVEKGGKIKIVRLSDNTVLSSAFLDITSKINAFNEGGLLGLAFHPDYASNGYFYVDYTSNSSGFGPTVVERYTVSGDPNVADANSGVKFLEVPQLGDTHNGGMLAFRPNDPNHYLYVALGDGSGGSGRPNAQNTDNKLGAILRIDVDAGAPADTSQPNVPSSNPFVGETGDDAIWVYGLRNPFRFSFDRITGDMYIGDVGESTWEEIDFQASNSAGGENFGWSLLEGSHDFDCGDCNGARASTTLPIYEYAHNGNSGCVSGGYVYRGDSLPEQTGRYFYADYTQNIMESFVFDGSSVSDVKDHTGELSPSSVPSFGEDAAGNLYFVNVSGGQVYRITDPDPITEQSTVYVDFDYLGPQFGTQLKPYRKVSLGLLGVLDNGTVRIQPGSTSETMTVNRPVRIEAVSGPVTLGASGGARNVRSQVGFVAP